MNAPAPKGEETAGVPLAVEGSKPQSDSEQSADAIARARTMKLVSLGGCVSYCIVAMLAEEFQHVHRWRRPVVSMMSPALDDLGPTSAKGSYAKYIAEDASKHHRDEIDAGGSALIFDISRDIFTGVVRCGESFISHPNQLPMLSDVTELGGPVDLDTLFAGRTYNEIDLYSDDFFDLWRAATDAFITRYRERYERLVCILFYRSSRSAWGHPDHDGFAHPFDAATLAKENALLERMGRVIAGYDCVTVLDLPQRYAFSGGTVPYGQAPMHFSPELHALAAEWLRAILNPGDPRQGRSLVEQAFKRFVGFERAVRHRDALNDEVADLRKHRDELLKLLETMRSSRTWRYGQKIATLRQRLRRMLPGGGAPR